MRVCERDERKKKKKKRTCERNERRKEEKGNYKKLKGVLFLTGLNKLKGIVL